MNGDDLDLDDLIDDNDPDPDQSAINKHLRAHSDALDKKEKGALEIPEVVEDTTIDTDYEIPPPHVVSIESDELPKDEVDLSLDLLHWRGVPDPKVPRFNPIKLTLVLNLDTLPSLASDEVQGQIAFLINQYAERLNGQRLICQGIAQLTLQKASLRSQLRRDKQRMGEERKKLLLKVSEELDPHDRTGKKKKYTNDQQRSAAVEVKILENAEFRAIDERIFNTDLDVEGITAKIDALEIERKALIEEISALKESLHAFIQTGIVAAAQLERVGFD